MLRNVYLQTFSTKNSIFSLSKEQFIKSVNDFGHHEMHDFFHLLAELQKDACLLACTTNFLSSIPTLKVTERPFKPLG